LFGEIPHIATVFSKYERGLLELSWVQESGILVENFSKY
jgi:hypothetical protein